MIQLLAIIIATACVAGVGMLIEGATGVWQGTKRYVRTRLRAPASPHAKDGSNDDEHSKEKFI
jgi:hypothetical protein